MEIKLITKRLQYRECAWCARRFKPFHTQQECCSSKCERDLMKYQEEIARDKAIEEYGKERRAKNPYWFLDAVNKKLNGNFGSYN